MQRFSDFLEGNQTTLGRSLADVLREARATPDYCAMVKWDTSPWIQRHLGDPAGHACSCVYLVESNRRGDSIICPRVPGLPWASIAPIADLDTWKRSGWVPFDELTRDPYRPIRLWTAEA